MLPGRPRTTSARRLELLALDAFRERGYDAVTVEAVIETMNRNVENARAVIRAAVPLLPAELGCGCDDALKNAIMTAPDRISPEARERLGLLIDKYV